MRARIKLNQRRAGESIRDFVERNKLTKEQTAWTESQQVIGHPSLSRLSAALTDAGFADIELGLSDEGENLSFRVQVTELVPASDSDALLRQWITAFRKAGFRIGFEEIGIADVKGSVITGHTLTAPPYEIARRKQ